MKPRILAPRLLPATIGVLAVVLAAKVVTLAHSVIVHGQPASMITAVWASTPAPAAPEKPGSKAAEHAAAAKMPPPIDLKPPAQEPAPDATPPMTDSERTVLLELRERRQELEARESTLSARESMLAAAEKKLSARIDELQSLQKKLESLDTSHRQQEDAAWQGLVKVYETMKPRDAAVIFNDLGMQVLLAVVGRMKEAKTAAILAAMLPDKAREVTMQLAQSRIRAATTAETGDKPAPAKPPGSGT